MPGGNTRGVVFFKPYPAYAKRAEGSRIWDVDGNERIDYCFNYGPLILGHKHPKIIEAVMEQLDRGILFGAPTETEVKLAEKIVEQVPCADKVRLVVTGTEAIMNALRISRAYTGRKKIGKFEGGFHGTGELWISTHPPLNLAGKEKSPNSIPASEGMPEEEVKEVIVMPYNNEEVVSQTIKKNRDALAAIIVEPILGVGGAVPAKKSFLKMLREETERYGIVLIFDEVMTGFRLAPGGGQEYFGIKPDLCILGKIIGGGFPIGAFAGNKDMMDLCAFPECSFPELIKPPVPSSGTFNAFPITMTVGLAQLNELNNDTYTHINNMGDLLRSSLIELMDDMNIKGIVTGEGSFFHVHFTDIEEIIDYRSSAKSDTNILRYFDMDQLNRGIYLAPAHVCFISAATTKDDIKQTLQSMEESLRSIKKIIYETSPNLIYD